MISEDLAFAPLRNHPECLEETAMLLNSQWSNSLAGRLQYLAEGKDDLPCSLILLQKDDLDCSKVIGHSRLSPVQGKPKATFLTCVIIEKSKRGRGLGKKLMMLTETYASQLGCTAIYLATYEKCEFYKHVGYQCCSQVTPVKPKPSLFTTSQLKLLREQFGEREAVTETDQEEHKLVDCRNENNNMMKEQIISVDEKSTQVTNTSHEKQTFNTSDGSNMAQTEICLTVPLAVQKPITSTSLPPRPSRIRSIFPKQVWMMKEIP